MKFEHNPQKVFGIRARARKWILIGIVSAVAAVVCSLFALKVLDTKTEADAILTDIQLARVKADLSAIEFQLSHYWARNLRVPTEEQGLEALVSKPTVEPIPEGWFQMISRIPMDPWNQEYIYTVPGDHGNQFDLFSIGPDGKRGTEDDIGNWEEESEF